MANSTTANAMSAAAKAAVAAMMKLPKQERIDHLVAMSRECIARQEDAAPILALIQMELDAPDDPSRPSSAAVADPARAKAKSKRRELTAKRNELRAMLAKVDARERTMEPPTAASRAAYAAAAPAPHGAQRHVVASHGSRRALAECLRATLGPIGSPGHAEHVLQQAVYRPVQCMASCIMHRAGNEERGKMLSNPRAMELMQKAQKNPRTMKALQDVQKNGPGALAKYASSPEVMEVVNELQSIRKAMGSQPADGVGSNRPVVMPTGLFVPGSLSSGASSPGKSAQSSPPKQTTLGGALGSTLGSHAGRTPAARGDVDALLRKAEGGGKASVGYSRARGSSGIFM